MIVEVPDVGVKVEVVDGGGPYITQAKVPENNPIINDSNEDILNISLNLILLNIIILTTFVFTWFRMNAGFLLEFLPLSNIYGVRGKLSRA